MLLLRTQITEFLTSFCYATLNKLTPPLQSIFPNHLLVVNNKKKRSRLGLLAPVKLNLGLAYRIF